MIIVYVTCHCKGWGGVGVDMKCYSSGVNNNSLNITLISINSLGRFCEINSKKVFGKRV